MFGGELETKLCLFAFLFPIVHIVVMKIPINISSSEWFIACDLDAFYWTLSWYWETVVQGKSCYPQLGCPKKHKFWENFIQNFRFHSNLQTASLSLVIFPPESEDIVRSANSCFAVRSAIWYKWKHRAWVWGQLFFQTLQLKSNFNPTSFSKGRVQNIDVWRHV